MQIPGIYVEIKGDATQLKKEIALAKQHIKENATEISNSLNNSLSADKISGNIQKMVANFGTLTRAAKTTSSVFDNIGVDVKKLTKVAGLSEAELGKLQSRLLKTQAASAQEASLRNLARQLNLTEKEVRAMGKQFGLSSTQIDRVVGVNNRARASYLSLGNAAKAGLAYISGQAIASGIGSLIATADKYTLLESRIRLVAKEGENLDATQKVLYDSSNRVRSSYESQADMYIRTARSMSDFNITQQQTVAYAEAITRSMVISGATIQEAASFAIQFSQAMQKGNLNDDEFKAVMESNGRAVKVLTDYLTSVSGGLKITAGDLRQMSTDGKITADVLYNAFSHSATQLEKEFDSMTKTVGQASTHFKNAFGSLVDGTNDATGATGGLVRSIDGLAGTVENNKDEIIALFTGITTAAGWAIERVSNLTNAVKGMAAVAAGELKLSKFALMNPQDLKTWMSDYESGLSQASQKAETAALKLKKLRESDIPDDAALSSSTKEFEAAKKELEELKLKKKEIAGISLVSAGNPMGTVSKNVSAGEVKKNAEEIEKAYKAAYSTIGASSKEVYNAMKAQYSADRDEFIKRTGDKVTAQKIYDEQIKKLDESKNGLGGKASSESLKGEREELKQLNAEIKNYADAAKDAKKAADEWLSAAGRASDDIANLADQYATVGMGEFATGAYEQGKALEEAQKAIEAYSGALETVDAQLAETTAAYQLASSQFDQMQAKFGGNAAGSGFEDENKLKAQSDIVKELAENVKSLSAEKSKLESQKGSAQGLVANIDESFRIERLKSAYGQIGAYTTEIYDVLAKEYEADRDAFIASGGSKVAADKMFKQQMADLDLSNPATTWAESVEIGLGKVADLADHTGANIAAAIEKGFDSASDALAEFVTTGKADFSGLVNSMINDLARIVIQKQITSPIAGAMESGMASLASMLSFNAHGNVFSSPALSTYSNSIVSSPTVFPFAKGVGLMGEAGDEAILPLKRGSNGDLGVKAQLSAAMPPRDQMQPMVVNVHEAPGTTSTVKQSSDGMTLEVIVEQIESSMNRRIARGKGPLSWLGNTQRRG